MAACSHADMRTPSSDQRGVCSPAKALNAQASSNSITSYRRVRGRPLIVSGAMNRDAG